MTTINEEREQDGLPPVEWGDTPTQIQAAERNAERMANMPPPEEPREADDEEPPKKSFDELTAPELSFAKALIPHIERVAAETIERIEENA